MRRLTVTIESDEDTHTYDFNITSLTSRHAAKMEAEGAYCLALLRSIVQKARELSDLSSEAWARETRQEERRGA